MEVLVFGLWSSAPWKRLLSPIVADLQNIWCLLGGATGTKSLKEAVTDRTC